MRPGGSEETGDEQIRGGFRHLTSHLPEDRSHADERVGTSVAEPVIVRFWGGRPNGRP